MIQPVREVADAYGLKVRTIKSAIRLNKFPSSHFGKMLAIDPDTQEFQAWLVGCKRGRRRVSATSQNSFTTP